MGRQTSALEAVKVGPCGVVLYFVETVRDVALGDIEAGCRGAAFGGCIGLNQSRIFLLPDMVYS